MVNPDRIKVLCHPEVFKRVPPLERMMVRHYRNKRCRPPLEPIILSRGGRTMVILKIGLVEYTGVTDCSLQDTFCKRTGRELAFKRAIRQYWDTLPRISRERV